MSINRSIKPKTNVTKAIKPKSDASKNLDKTEILITPNAARVKVETEFHLTPEMVLTFNDNSNSLLKTAFFLIQILLTPNSILWTKYLYYVASDR